MDIFETLGEAIDYATELEKGIHNTGVFNTGLHVDVDTNEDTYIVQVELPGLDEENIDINYEKDTLTVKASYGEGGLRHGDYERAFPLRDVDATKINATLNKGILKIVLHKLEEKKARKININIGE